MSGSKWQEGVESLGDLLAADLHPAGIAATWELCVLSARQVLDAARGKLCSCA